MKDIILLFSEVAAIALDERPDVVAYALTLQGFNIILSGGDKTNAEF